MKILVIGTIDNKGGAAQVSWELRKRLKADGHTVNTLVRYKYSDEPDVFVIPRKPYQDWLVKLFANDLKFAKTEYIFNTKEYIEADVIHCHNLHSNFFNLKNLIRMSKEKPMIWTLHDMWAFTGFPYNSFTLRNPNKKKFLLFLWDNTPRLFEIKRKIYNQIKINVVTVSKWLREEAEKSILGGQKISYIWNGIDINTFTPKNKKDTRSKFGLPQNKKIVGCGIKGWIDSQKIIEMYKDRGDVFFVAIGHSNIKTDNRNFIVLPRTEDRQILSEYLSTLDVFLHPTQEDSFGLISAEAMSCGIPVVAYEIDALPEVITHKETGYITKYNDINDAKCGIDYILNLTNVEYLDMSKHTRQRIVDGFSCQKMYENYMSLYEKVLEKTILKP